MENKNSRGCKLYFPKRLKKQIKKKV